MAFLGRRRELGTLRSLFDRPDPVLAHVTGPPGIGKSALVARAVADLPHVRAACPPLPDPDIRAAARRAAEPLLHGPEEDGAPPPSWAELARRLREATGREERPRILVLDDAHRLAEARSEVEEPLRRLLQPGRGTPLHLVLVGRAPGLPELAGREPDAVLRLRPLPFRDALPLLPGRDAVERIRAYGTFGGMPAHLRHLDTDVTPGTNVRRLALTPGGPLARAGLDLLERTLQTPARYVAILAVLARGESEWRDVHAGVRDLTSSGQVAPYLRRLEEMGLVEVRRSLDAPPRSRSRRYRILDPFVAFWFRFLLPALDRAGARDATDLLSEVIRPELDDHMAHVFPEVCRQYMERDVMELLAANARETGSLWGDGYDLPVAGILASGVPFYGTARWGEAPGPALLTLLDRAIRETRYGFGRELRLRAVFSPSRFPRRLERLVASRQDGILVGPEALAGEG